MTATDIAPATSTGEAAKPAAATTAAPATPAATESLLASAAKAAAAAPPIDAAKTAEAAHDYSSVKFEGMHPDTTKAFVEAVGEHKIDPKAAQAILNKVMGAVKARGEAAQKAQAEAEKAAIAAEKKAWQEELAKDPMFAPEKAEANSKAAQLAFQHAPKGVFDRLKQDGLDEHPAVTQLVVSIGQRLMQATSVDTTAPNVSVPSPGDETARWRASNPKTIAGLKAMGVNVN